MAADPRDPIAELIPPEMRGHLGFMLSKARQFLVDEVEVVLAGHDLGVRHFAALNVLRRGQPLRQTDICGAMAIDRTTAMKLVDDLEQRGFVQRVRHTEDRRAYNVDITAAGRAFFESMLPAVIACEQGFMAPLSPGERALLQEMLLRLVTSAIERRSADNHS